MQNFRNICVKSLCECQSDWSEVNINPLTQSLFSLFYHSSVHSVWSDHYIYMHFEFLIIPWLRQWIGYFRSHVSTLKRLNLAQIQVSLHRVTDQDCMYTYRLFTISHTSFHSLPVHVHKDQLFLYDCNWGKNASKTYTWMELIGFCGSPNVCDVLHNRSMSRVCQVRKCLRRCLLWL